MTEELVRLEEIADRFLIAEAAIARTKAKVKASAPLERKLEKELKRLFALQAKGFLRRFAALRPKFPELEEAIREDDWGPMLEAALAATRRLTERTIRDATNAGLLAGAGETIADAPVELSFTLEHPSAVAFLRDYAAARVTLIDDGTRAEIAAIVTRSVVEGWAYGQTAKAIADRFEEFRVGRPQEHIRSRAHLVAITEVGEAYEHGALLAAEAIEELGTPMEKSWSTIGDGRVSAGCRENARKGWIPLGDEFPSGHQRPLRFPGCRCALLTRAASAS